MSILDKSSLVMIPSGYKEDILYSVKPRNGEGDFTFTRASTGTRVNADGYIEEVPWNLVTNSNDLSYLSTSNVIKTTNAITSPIGSNDGISVVNTNNYGNLFKTNVTIKKDSNFTQSVYVKPFSTSFIYMRALSFDNDMFCWFDLENVSVGTDAYNIGSIEQAEDGWVRCSITFTSTTNLTGRLYLYATSADNQIAQTGDSVYYWGLQYNHGSPKPYIKTTDRLDIPRLDYSGGATNPTLLLEPQRTNLIPYSEDFSQWGAINSNRTLINNTNPIDNNAYEIESSVTSSASRIYYSAIMTAGNDYSSTYLVKPSLNSPQYLGFACISNTQPDVLYDFANDQFVDFNIVGNAAKCESISMNNGWKLLKVPVHESVLNTRLNIYQGSRVGNNLYGTTGESYYIKFAQLEQGNYTTSYIPTNGTSVTRVADVCQDAGDATIFNDSEGVLFTEIAALNNDLTFRGISLSDGTAANRIVIYLSDVSNRIRLIVRGNNVLLADLFFDVSNTLDYHKIAAKYKADDFALWINGVEVATDLSGTSMPIGLNQVRFANANGGAEFYGKCKQVAIFNEALTDEELTTLTTI